MFKNFWNRMSRSNGHDGQLNGQAPEATAMGSAGGESMKVMKKGHAMRVIFFYPGEEGTYVDNAEVTLFENGIVHLKSNQEETTTHLQNCEILWRFETDAEERTPKVRLLKPKSEKGHASEAGTDEVEVKPSGKKGSDKNPELR